MAPRSSLLALLLASCPKPEDTAAGTAPFLGADPSVPAAEGEARAGVIRDGEAGEAALFGGINAEGRAGDVKIYNRLVQFVIQGAYRSHGYVATGGGIIDADLVRDDDTLGRDLIEDQYLAFGLARLFDAEMVEILNDGSDGGAAVVRSTGTDVPWEWFQGMFELDDPTIDELGLAIVTTYTLEPDAYGLSIDTELSNQGDESALFTPQDGLWATGEDALQWAPGTGFDEAEGNDLAAMVYVGRTGEASFAMWPHEGSYTSSVISQLAAEYGIALVELDPVELAPGESVTLRRTFVVAPDTATAEAARREAQGEELGSVVGTVVDSSNGEGVAGVRVHVVDEGQAGGVAGFALTDESGAWQARLPPGTWTAWALGHAELEHVEQPEGSGRYAPFAASSVNAAQLAAVDGSAPARQLPFAMGSPASQGASFVLEAGASETLDLEISPPGSLLIELLDQQGVPLPGVVELRWADGVPPASEVPEDLRDALGVPTGGRAGWAWTANGELAIPVLPGTYDLEAGHSWRHERATADDVEVVAGETTTLTLTVEQVVERGGWLAMDNHLHGSPSFDGALPMEDRLLACAATGVELPVITDHDVHVDYAPLAEAMGLNERLAVFPGVEVTTMIRGHFNLFPIEPTPTVANGGALQWWIDPASTPTLFEQMRTVAAEDAMVQVNHPRTPGMVAFAGYEPATGEYEVDYWSWDFDSFELKNGGVDDLHTVRDDWFSWLNQGWAPTPTGVSDSHYRFIPCGLGRTDVHLGTDEPAEVDWTALREALQAGHVVVASGTTLRATIGDALPGDTITGSSLAIDVLVQAPSWITPGTLRVYRNGDLALERALTERDDSGVWFDEAIAIELEADAWIVVEVEGSEPLGDFWRNHAPYAATNAFFVDVEGDGWEAPGL